MTVFILLSHPQPPPQLPIQIKQQPSGNMDDSGFFSIQVSSHKRVLRVVHVPGTVQAEDMVDVNIFSQPFMVTVTIKPSEIPPINSV